MTTPPRRPRPTGRFPRRTFLGAAASVGAAGALDVTASTPGGATITRAAAVAPAGSDLGAVEHVVLLMQENRSFDHYFGSHYAVRGFDDHPPGRPGVFAQRWPSNVTRTPVKKLLPFHLDTGTEKVECTWDLSHSWTAQHDCWNHGAMDRFVTTHCSPQFEGATRGELTMGYYDRSDLPFYYALADNFTICDGYHCSVFGPTDPNRMFWMSGTNSPSGSGGGVVITTSQDLSDKWSRSWATMPEALEDHGVSWKVYNPAGPLYDVGQKVSFLTSNNRLMYFQQYRNPSSPLHRKAFGYSFVDHFAADVAAGNLPQVSWLVAPTIGNDQSEHPAAPPARGEYFTHRVLDILASNPRVWSRTVFILSYDENDGFFDHVPPPTPPPGTAGEYLTVDPLPADAGGVAGPVGLGFRVPCLVISPFSRGGGVAHQTFDHTSQLRFLEHRFGVPVPNLSSWRRSVTGDLTSALHMESATVPLPALPTTPLTPPDVALECTSIQLELEDDDPSQPPPRIPTNQQMPVQESPPAAR